MPAIKIPRKSTMVDMTAMCDVAFLLLSFFILTTKFKPAEALTVTTPQSVATQVAEEKDVVLITMDKEGKVYFSVSDEAMDAKRAILDELSEIRSISFTDQERNAFLRAGSFVGVPFSQLKSYLALSSDDAKNFASPGIPVMDSATNELRDWMRAANSAFMGQRMNLMIKGDGEAKYPSFKGIIDAFKANDILKFQMITDPKGVPEGSELDIKTRRGGGTAAATEE